MLNFILLNITLVNNNMIEIGIIAPIIGNIKFDGIICITAMSAAIM